MSNMAIYKDPLLHAARAIDNRRLVGERLQDWWDKYDQLKTIFNKHGTLESHLTAHKLDEWVRASQKKWQDGLLDTEQIKALKDIGISRQPTMKGRPPARGKKLDRISDLFERAKKGDRLSPEEQSELDKGLTYYRRQRRQGNISDATADRLELDAPMPPFSSRQP